MSQDNIHKAHATCIDWALTGHPYQSLIHPQKVQEVQIPESDVMYIYIPYMVIHAQTDGTD